MKNTIGFNNTKNIWTSKYDYVSSNYSSIDKRFISCDKTIDPAVDTIAWEHHKNVANNNFYGEQYNSAIAVSFNDNISQNKIYKTFSVEGTENLTGSLNTIRTSEFLQPGSPPSTISIGTLSNKGGILYGHMPRDPRVKANVNLKYVGSIPVVEGSLGVVSQQDNLYTLNGVYGSAPTFSGKTSLVFSVENDSELFGFNANGSPQTIVEGQDYSGIPAGISIPQESDITGNQSAFYKDGILIKTTPQAFAAFASRLGSLAASGSVLNVFAVSDPQLNGDFLRGQYAEAVINLGSQNFELYALNVNYEPTDLDHSK